MEYQRGDNEERTGKFEDIITVNFVIWLKTSSHRFKRNFKPYEGRQNHIMTQYSKMLKIKAEWTF